jgi:hypothetical protein
LVAFKRFFQRHCIVNGKPAVAALCHLQRYAGGAYASRTGSRQQSMFAVDAGPAIDFAFAAAVLIPQ